MVSTIIPLSDETEVSDHQVVLYKIRDTRLVQARCMCGKWASAETSPRNAERLGRLHVGWQGGNR